MHVLSAFSELFIHCAPWETTEPGEFWYSVQSLHCDLRFVAISRRIAIDFR